MGALIVIERRGKIEPPVFRDFMRWRPLRASCKHRYALPCEELHGFRTRALCAAAIFGLVLLVCGLHLAGIVPAFIPLGLLPLAAAWLRIADPYLEARFAWQSHRREITSRKAGASAIKEYLDACGERFGEWSVHLAGEIGLLDGSGEWQTLEMWWQAFFREAGSILISLQTSRSWLDAIEQAIQNLERRKGILDHLLNREAEPGRLEASLEIEIETAPAHLMKPPPPKPDPEAAQDLRAQMTGIVEGVCEALRCGLRLIWSHLA